MTTKQRNRIQSLSERVNLTDEWVIFIRFALARDCTIRKASRIINRLTEMEREQSPDPKTQNWDRWNRG